MSKVFSISIITVACVLFWTGAIFRDTQTIAFCGAIFLVVVVIAINIIEKK